MVKTVSFVLELFTVDLAGIINGLFLHNGLFGFDLFFCGWFLLNDLLYAVLILFRHLRLFFVVRVFVFRISKVSVAFHSVCSGVTMFFFLLLFEET